MKTKKTILVFFLSLLILCLSSFSVLATELDSVPTSYDLKIMHTNDIHSRYDYQEGKIIGYSRLKTLKDEHNPSLLLDAGDTFHGQSFATISKGESIAQLIKAVGYDAMVPGNHDFNYGSAQLKNLGAAANLTLLGANITTSEGSPFFDDSYYIKEIDLGNNEPLKIGVFGIISPDIYDGISSSYVSDLSFGPDHASAIATAKASVSALKAEDCDIIVALAHVGDSNNGTLLRSDEIASGVDGIDIIIDGHTHDIENNTVNNTLIAQTGSYFNNIGLVNLKVEKQEDHTYAITEKTSSLISPVEAASVSSDPTIDQLISDIKEEQAPILNKVVGNTPVPLDWSWEKVRIQELNLGRVTTDAYRFETGADIGIENAGGLRAGIPEGDITKGEVINVLPFGNYLTTKEILGSDILDMLETNIETEIKNNVANDSGDYNAWPSNSGSYLQWSGIKASYDLEKPLGERIDQNSILIGDAKLDLNKKYTIAGSNYVTGSSDYPALQKAPILKEYVACDEGFIHYLESSGTERFLTAVNTPNLTKATIIDPPSPVPPPDPNPTPVIPDPEPINPVPTPIKPEPSKQSTTTPSPSNPKTGITYPSNSLLLAFLSPLFKLL